MALHFKKALASRLSPKAIGYYVALVLPFTLITLAEIVNEKNPIAQLFIQWHHDIEQEEHKR